MKKAEGLSSWLWCWSHCACWVASVFSFSFRTFTYICFDSGAKHLHPCTHNTMFWKTDVAGTNITCMRYRHIPPEKSQTRFCNFLHCWNFLHLHLRMKWFWILVLLSRQWSIIHHNNHEWTLRQHSGIQKLFNSYKGERGNKLHFKMWGL